MQIESPPVSGYPGISLRQLERADIDAWYAYLSLPHVVEHTSWNLRSQADLLPMFDAFESTATQSVRRLAMVSDDDAKLIGTIGFHMISDVSAMIDAAAFV